MRRRVAIFLLAALAPLCGQEKERVTDLNDIRSFLVESQIVEYRPKLLRDPFLSTQEDRGREQSEMLIDDITIIGRVVANKKAYLIVLDSPRRDVRQLPIGFRFQDGEIAAITEAEAVFTTWDSALGPKSPIKRTVRKPFKREEVRW